MTNPKELMTEWIASQRAKYKIIDSWRDIPENEKNILKAHVTTPFYHFERESDERRMREQSQRDKAGRESGDEGFPTSANVGPDTRTGESNPARPNGRAAAISASPSSARGNESVEPAQRSGRVRVTVIGNTKDNKEWLKDRKFRWDPYRKWWHGTIESVQVSDFEKQCAERKMQISVE